MPRGRYRKVLDELTQHAYGSAQKSFSYRVRPVKRSIVNERIKDTEEINSTGIARDFQSIAYPLTCLSSRRIKVHIH